MHDWIFGYLRGAPTRGNPASAGAWKSVSAALGPAPKDLEAFYSQADGAKLAGDVTLYPLAEGEPSVVSRSGTAAGGFKANRVWRFGEHGAESLVAARRKDVSLTPELKRSTWPKDVPADAWVWLRCDSKRALKAYASLEKLLEVLVPPTETEEFGEPTLARALTAVQSALAGLEDAPKAAKKKSRGSH
jgi:hypothetical protein